MSANLQLGTTNDVANDFPAIRFATWEDFKSFISRDLLSAQLPHDLDPRYLFRGHGEASWLLESKFERTFQSLPDSERTEKHESLRRFFVQECEHFQEYKQLLADELECLALAQHHGLPTRLLDWSDSPYVAAFFAFDAHLGKDHGKDDSGKQKEVAIWVLDRAAGGYWDGQRGVSVFRPQAWRNERQKRQSGWFSNAKIPHRTIEEYVQALGNKRNALRKVILPAAMAELALRDLKLMRISARDLFADLDGAAANALLRAVLANDIP